MKGIYHISSLLFILGIILIGLTLKDIFVQQKIISPLLPTSATVTKQPTPTPTSVLSAWVSAALPTSVYDDQIFLRNTVTTILPLWYSLDRSGNIVQTEKEASSSAHYILPVVTDNNDPSRIHAFLESKEKQQQGIELLVDDASLHRYAGYDINWQNLDGNDAKAYLSFLHDLHLKLAASERILSVTVTAPPNGSSGWGDTIGIMWPTLASTVDYLRIMMYNQEAQRSQNEPLIDPFWYQNVIRFASEILPKEKIIIGLPIVTVESKGRQQQYRSDKKPLEWQRDVASGELTATVSAQGVLHTVWREDTESIEAKKRLAQQYNIFQFSFWYMNEPTTTVSR